MKNQIMRLLCTLLFVTLLQSCSSNGSSSTGSREDCVIAQCTANAETTGQRCKHCVSNRGDSFCWQHD